MLMRGEHSLWRAGFDVLTVICTSLSTGLWRPVVVLCHAVCSPGYFNNKQMKYPLRTVFLPTSGASWRVHPTGRCLSARMGPTYQKNTSK